MSSNLNNFLDLGPSEKGGLFHVRSPKGGSTQFSLSYVDALFDKVDPSYPSPSALPYCAWISNEAVIYPPALVSRFSIPLSQWLVVRPQNSNEAWRVGLETVNTGIFGWVFVRPSEGCHPSHLRRLQIAAERTRTKIFLLGKAKLPHWMLTRSIELIPGASNDETNSLHSQLFVRRQSGRGVPVAYAQG